MLIHQSMNPDDCSSIATEIVSPSGRGGSPKTSRRGGGGDAGCGGPALASLLGCCAADAYGALPPPPPSGAGLPGRGDAPVMAGYDAASASCSGGGVGGGGGTRSSPFRKAAYASNPLLGRADSLVQHEPSLMSLVASDFGASDDEDDLARSTGRGLSSPAKSARSVYSAPSPRSAPRTPQKSGSSPRMTAKELRKTLRETDSSSAMELSEARLEAQSAAGPGHRATYRESLRNHRGLIVPAGSPPRPRGRKQPTSGEKSRPVPECPESPSKRLRSDASAPSAGPGRRAAVVPHESYGVADAPVWNAGDPVNPELQSTYSFPRLCVRDPVDVIESGEDAWWFDLQRRMFTTLPHARDGRVADLLARRDAGRPGSHASGGSSVSTGGVSCHAMRNLCLDVDPRDTPVNCWSEPVASTLKVRGDNYGRDGVKVESESAFLRVLGVDSFGGGEAGEEEGRRCTDGFLRRWRGACEEIGLERPPFLLIVNFIVPWGSFRAYFCRPDADDGPHSTSLSAEPSERAWRAFVEGDQSYRNARLKFIPRVVAGPWIVRKVVGSTPAIIGNKLPVTYRGSAGEGYLEVSMDVTAGPSIGNTIANTVVGRADAVTVDLAFVVEAEGEMLPERICGAVRLHHLSMKRAPGLGEWMERVDRRVR